MRYLYYTAAVLAALLLACSPTKNDATAPAEVIFRQALRYQGLNSPLPNDSLNITLDADCSGPSGAFHTYMAQHDDSTYFEQDYTYRPNTRYMLATSYQTAFALDSLGAVTDTLTPLSALFVKSHTFPLAPLQLGLHTSGATRLPDTTFFGQPAQRVQAYHSGYALQVIYYFAPQDGRPLGMEHSAFADSSVNLLLQYHDWAPADSPTGAPLKLLRRFNIHEQHADSTVLWEYTYRHIALSPR